MVRTIRTKDAQKKKQNSPNVQTVLGHMLHLTKGVPKTKSRLSANMWHNNPTYVINHSFQSSIGPIVEIFLPAMHDIKMMVRKFVKPRVSIDSGMSSCSNVCHLSC